MLVAILKIADKVGFQAMRYIRLFFVLQKFYVRALLAADRRERQSHETSILCFELGRCTVGPTGMLRQILSKAAEWGVGAFMASADVEGAFDGLRYEDVAQALLQKKGVHSGGVCALVRESLAGAPVSPAFPHARGARMGSGGARSVEPGARQCTSGTS